MRKMIDILLYTLAVVGVTMILTAKCSRGKLTEVVKTDTVKVYDTLTYVDVRAVDSVVLRYEQIRLPIVAQNSYSDENTPIKPCGDSLSLRNTTDSADVILPITQKHYSDTIYDAWVSGYLPRLDSIKVYPVTNYITKTITRIEYDKRKKYSLGIQVGGGYNGKEFCPYVGIGIQRKIFEW